MFFCRKKPHKTRDGRLALCLAAHNIDLFLDVGANNGQTGQMLRANGFKGTIVSYEPLSKARVKLLAASEKDENWHVAPAMALGATTGFVDMHVSESTDMSSIAAPCAELLAALPKTKETAIESVPINRLDDVALEWIGGAKAPFLKIDAQGHDLAVLEGASGIINHVQGVHMEMSLFPLYEGEPDYRVLCERLHALGFKPYLMQERTYSRKLNRQLQIDGTFFRQ